MVVRLLELMRLKNLTSSQLADTLGVQRSGISHFISGRNKPGLDFILKILERYPDINPDWLLFGRQPVFRSGQELNQLTEVSDEISEPGGKIVEKAIMDVPEMVSQPSLLEELFQETGDEKLQSDQPTPQIVQKQANSKRNKPETLPAGKTGDKDLKNEKVLINQGQEAKPSPDRIVMFYPDGTFREYLPA
jgi:transcriptional regulator with XRE-family HTH domain